MLGSGDRMSRHEARQRRAQVAPGFGDHVLLGAAGVGENRLRRELARDGSEERGKLRHRRREQHQVGTGEFARPVGIDPDRMVDDAARAGELEVGGAAPDAHDRPDPARGLERQRE